MALDTDSWLYLLSGIEDRAQNEFEELLFWIDCGEIKCVLPANIKTEWERNKSKKVQQIRNALAEYQKFNANIISANKVLREAADPSRIESIALERIDKLDSIFATCEVAPVTDDLLIEAGKRSLSEIPPNHNNDSFRDTVNILSLIKFIKEKGYTKCHFVSENYKDFSDLNNKAKLHRQLKLIFEEIGLAYTYKIQVFLSKMRRDFPSYLDYLKLQKEREDKDEIKDSIHVPFVHEDLDNEYLDHLPYIDKILSKKNPTGFEKTMLHTLMQSHPSYKTYVFSKIEVE